METNGLILKTISSTINDNLASDGCIYFYKTEESAQSFRDESAIMKHIWSPNHPGVDDYMAKGRAQIQNTIFNKVLGIIKNSEYRLLTGYAENEKAVAISDEGDILNLVMTDTQIFLIIIESGQW